MYVDWTEVNERRISEKTQEIRLYCAQKKSSMTERAFELARLSLDRLLKIIEERNPQSNNAIKSIRQGMSMQNECVAVCSEKQAFALARGIVYNYIGDDLNLYPVTAEKKLLRSKMRKLSECDIPINEMTTQDIIYVASAIADGENFSKATMRSVFEWFMGIGLDPIQTRVFAVLFMKQEAISINALPQQSLFSADYKKAVKGLVKKGFICELPGDLYCVNEITFG